MSAEETGGAERGLARETPQSSPGASHDVLGNEFVRAAARRLGLVGLTMAGLMVLGVLLVLVGREVLGWRGAGPPGPPPLAAMARVGLFVALSLGVFGLSRTDYSPRRLLNIGLAYQLAGAILFTFPRFASDKHLLEHSTQLGFLGLWIVIFPLFVPARPVKNIVASLLTATTAPVMYFVFVAVQGRPVASLEVVGSTFFPYYWCAGLAVVPAILIYRLGRTVTAAQRQVGRLDDLLRTERLAVAGSLAAGVAHEVNNPLAAISSLVQTVQGKNEDPRARELLGEALEHMDRISTTLKELLQFARPPARVARVCSLNEVVERTLHLLQHDKRFRRVSIETRLDPALGTIQADPDQLQQVLTNLLLNARDAAEGRADARIVVATCPSRAAHLGDPGVELTVTDNGPGIPAEARERVFEPFFTTKPPGEGTGLGLAVCRELLREHEGAIALDAGEGGGTTARITLPLRGGTT